jgi:hypothetical protein
MKKSCNIIKKFDDLLQPTEKILWSGRPKTGIMLRPFDMFYIPLSLILGGSMIGFGWIAISEYFSMRNPNINYLIMGIFFFLSCLHLIFGRFFVDAKLRENTFYCLTTERAIIISGVFSRKVKTINLKNISEVFLSEKSDGSGMIHFGSSPNPNLYQDQFMRTSGGFLPGYHNNQSAFELIPNARDVYQKIQNVQSGKYKENE